MPLLPDDAEVERVDELGQPSEHRDRVHGVAAPVLDHHEEVPAPRDPGGALDRVGGEPDEPVGVAPELGVLLGLLEELAKRAPTAIISGRSVEDLRSRVGTTVTT